MIVVGLWVIDIRRLSRAFAVQNITQQGSDDGTLVPHFFATISASSEKGFCTLVLQ